MTTANKYGSKPFWWNPTTQQKETNKTSDDCVYWDSLLEFSVYCQLRKLYPEKAITRQVPIVLKPATLNYPEQCWKCDFRVLDPILGHYNLEVKGFWIKQDSAANADFRKTLMLLDTFNLEEYLRLIVISDKWFPLDKRIRTIKFYELQNKLKEIQDRWQKLKSQ